MIFLACGTGACLIVAGVVLGAGAVATALGLRKPPPPEEGEECDDPCDHCPPHQRHPHACE